MSYVVNEIFRSLQGEGHRAGVDNVFVRFTGCNMRCSLSSGPKSPGGFDCDTEFMSGRRLSLQQLIEDIMVEDTYHPAKPACKWVILTGGEPGLQCDKELCTALHAEGYRIAIETNGSVALPWDIDYIAVSPKVAEHCIRQKKAHEVRYVRGYGQALPETVVQAEHYFISPAFNGNTLDQRTLDWCRQLCEGTRWKLSVQQHKLVGLR